MQSLSHSKHICTIFRQNLPLNYLGLASKISLPMSHCRRRLSKSFVSGATRKASTNASTQSEKGFFSWYTRQLDERPLTTKIISSALIAAAGDIICQVLENNLGAKPKDAESDTGKAHSGRNGATASLDTDIDWLRTGRFFVIGAFWVAPTCHVWYGFLSTRLIPGVSTPKRVVQRLFLDQFGAAPFFCSAFMGLLWLLEGKHPSDVKADLIEAGPTLVTSNWKLWIPAMGFMFSVVPLKFQVVYSNFVGLVWTVYLSYASTRLASQPLDQE